MKLEAALPEIRKGRRFKRANSKCWYAYFDIKRISLEDLFDVDDIELEPLPAPKMKAWISEEGDIRFFKDGDMEYQNWTRAEWLDEK